MCEAYREKRVEGFTTNPTLMRGSGITDYCDFAQSALEAIPDLPISFEVFSDELDEMAYEARQIASWGGIPYVKVPITNTRGESTAPLIDKLSSEGIRVNVTAVMTLDQVRAAAQVLEPDVPSIVSVFAGRIADTGVDPEPLMSQAATILSGNPNAELLWASPRELLNIFQAERVGCHIITALSGILSKLPLVGRDLDDFSLDTVRMFHGDAKAAGYKIP
jgi:transaldolase